MMNKEIVIAMALVISIIEIYMIINLYRQKRHEYFFENIGIYGVVLIFLLGQYYFEFQIKGYIILFVLFSIIGHSFVGEYLDYYNKSKYYDRFLHFFGTFSFTLFAYSIIYLIEKPIHYSPLYVSLFVTTLGIAMGVLFELLEFAHDTFMKSDIQAQHGLKDTNLDLMGNVIGALLAGVLSFFVFY